MEPLWSVGLALIGVLCIALCGYYVGMCYFDKLGFVDELVKQDDKAAKPPACKNAAWWAGGFGAAGLLAISGSLYMLWPQGRRANAHANKPSLADLRARYAAAAAPNMAAADYAKSLRAAE